MADEITEFRDWLQYRDLPPNTTLRELIEHEREVARLEAVRIAVTDPGREQPPPNTGHLDAACPTNPSGYHCVHNTIWCCKDPYRGEQPPHEPPEYPEPADRDDDRHDTLAWASRQFAPVGIEDCYAIGDVVLALADRYHAWLGRVPEDPKEPQP